MNPEYRFGSRTSDTTGSSRLVQELLAQSYDSSDILTMTIDPANGTIAFVQEGAIVVPSLRAR